MTFDLDRAWRLDGQVALRPEPFGALAYHYGTRRLIFLKTRKLTAVVESLDGQADAGARPASPRASPTPSCPPTRRRSGASRQAGMIGERR